MPHDATAVERVLPLKPNDYYVLFALVEADRYGYAIAKAIRERSEGRVRLEAGNLHRTIQKLIRQGLVARSDRRPAPDLDDERRRYYLITDFGRRALAKDAMRMKGLIEAAEAHRLIPGS